MYVCERDREREKKERGAERKENKAKEDGDVTQTEQKTTENITFYSYVIANKAVYCVNHSVINLFTNFCDVKQNKVCMKIVLAYS